LEGDRVVTIEIARDFSRTPGPRFRSLGPYSGEEFRERLVDALSASPDGTVEVVLDGTEGYGSSFLEEAFGGLVRMGPFRADELEHRLKIVAHDRLYETYADEAYRYLKDAIAASDKRR
jgi:hypothetical protein